MPLFPRVSRAFAPRPRLALGLILAAGLAACGGSGGDEPAAAPLPEVVFSLQVLHVADMDSGGDLVANSKALSALVNKFRAEQPARTVFLSSGDNYIPGPFFNAADDASLTPELGVTGAGRGDIEILNLMGLQASAVGNHDLDLGTNFFGALIGASGAWRGARFPYLSTNLDFSTDSNLASRAPATNNGAEASTLVGGRLAGHAVITVDGQRIGVVGASTPTLASITSTGGIGIRPSGALAADLDALAASIQPAVDSLRSQGIDKIVLLAHMQQIEVEQGLATRLRGVDLIVAGGSNTRLFDANDVPRSGETGRGTYPLSFTSPAGEPVLVVNVDADYKYLGRIVLPFDAQGRIIPGRLDSTVNGAYATDAAGLARQGLSVANAQPGVAAVADKIAAVIAAKDGALAGASSVYLEGDRVLVRNQETNLGNLTADANLAYAQTVDASTAISLKNGGGIRSSIGAFDVAPGATTGSRGPTRANPAAGKLAGDVSQLDIEFALRFNNGLSLVTVTAAELKALIEHGVSDWTPTSTQGKFPQVGGMRFSFDPSQPAGSRVRTLVVDDPNGAAAGATPLTVVSGGVVVAPAGTRFRMVTLDFLAGGGDGYPFAGLSAPNRIDQVAAGVTKTYATVGAEQQALAAFLAARFPRTAPFAAADSAPAGDARIQNLSLRSDGLATP